MNGSLQPRTDVGAGGIAGVLASVIMMVLQNDGVYNFQSIYALIFAVVVAAAGYLVGKHKSFVMFVAAPVATLVAAGVGKILYGAEWDNAVVSVALSTFLVALVGYLAPPVSPDLTNEPNEPAGERSERLKRPTRR